MIHNVFIVGDIKKVQVSEPKDPKKNASAVLLIQYGKTREQTGGPVEFVNAVMVRVPGFKFPALREKLVEGKKVTVHGHLQGVVKTVANEGFFTTELVADRIFIEDDEAAASSEG